MSTQPVMASSGIIQVVGIVDMVFEHRRQMRSDMIHIKTLEACSVGIGTDSGKWRILVTFELTVAAFWQVPLIVGLGHRRMLSSVT
jgi:hypothetical protein